MVALTAQDNQRNTPRDTSITSTDNTNPDPEKTHPHSYLEERGTAPKIIHTNNGTSKQQCPTQSTRGHPQQDNTRKTSDAQINKVNPSPDISTPGPGPVHKNPQTTVTNNGKTSITENITQDDPVPTIITISSSEDGSENNVEQPTVQKNQSKISKPHQKSKPSIQVPTFVVDNTNVTPQNNITIDKRDGSSHNRITISENTTQVMTPKEI